MSTCPRYVELGSSLNCKKACRQILGNVNQAHILGNMHLHHFLWKWISVKWVYNLQFFVYFKNTIENKAQNKLSVTEAFAKMKRPFVLMKSHLKWKFECLFIHESGRRRFSMSNVFYAAEFSRNEGNLRNNAGHFFANNLLFFFLEEIFQTKSFVWHSLVFFSPKLTFGAKNWICQRMRLTR